MIKIIRWGMPHREGYCEGCGTFGGPVTMLTFSPHPDRTTFFDLCDRCRDTVKVGLGRPAEDER